MKNSKIVISFLVFCLSFPVLANSFDLLDNVIEGLNSNYRDYDRFDKEIQMTKKPLIIEPIDRDLWIAIVEGQTRKVKNLMEQGADPNAINKAGSMSLHFSASYNRRTITGTLLENGARINAQDNDGDTALHIVAYRGNIRTAKVLLENGADTTIQNKYGDTAIEVATKVGKKRMVRFLENYDSEIALSTAFP